MSVRIIEVPYDSGHYGARMGAGPLRFAEGGLAGRLEGPGLAVRRSRLEIEVDFPTENTVAFEVARRLAPEIRAARRDGEFPLVLAGNCASCLGTVAGMDGERVGVVWLDAHGDFNTPETTPSGFLDGMALSMLVGDCWTTVSGSVPGFQPVAEEDVLLVGARALDAGERERLERSGVRCLDVDALGDDGAVQDALQGLAGRVETIYLHVDLDVLDPSEGRANMFASPNGLLVEEILDLVDRVEGAVPVGAAAITAYAPEVDADGRAAAAAEKVMRRLVEGR